MLNPLQNKPGIKLIVIVALTLMLLIPLMMIKGLNYERQATQHQVERDIAASSSGEQTITGPFITVNYHYTVTQYNEQIEKNAQLFILPQSYYVNTDLTTYEKYRGIYKALLYRAKTEATGAFEFSRLHELAPESIDSITLSIGVADVRGIGLGSRVMWGGESYQIHPGSGIEAIPDGIHIKLPLSLTTQSEAVDYQIDFELQGMKDLYFVPVGKETRIDLTADWPHPSFAGDYLPIESTISDQGHSASWITNPFSTNLEAKFDTCVIANQCTAADTPKIGVSLIEPVDHYLKSHRAINYAILIILMVFATFFLLEIFRAKPIHPIQYGFVGLALAVFYLLLISLSEHTGFNIAYGISALCSITLLSIYVSGMLNSSKQGGICFAALTLLYSALFGLLSAEDYALLMGSLLCFIVLGLLMLLTRKVDWYQGGKMVSDS